MPVHFLHRFGWELIVFVKHKSNRLNFRLREFTNLCPQFFMFLCGLLQHTDPSSFLMVLNVFQPVTILLTVLEIRSLDWVFRCQSSSGPILYIDTAPTAYPKESFVIYYNSLQIFVNLSHENLAIFMYYTQK